MPERKPSRSPRRVRVVEVFSTLWSRHPGLSWGAVVGLAVGLIVGLAMPTRYVAEVSFFPESKGISLPTGAVAAGLAGQLGVNLSSDGASSPRFYVALLNSRAVLELVLETPVRLSPQSPQQKLLDLLAPDAELLPKRIDNALRSLRKMLDTRIQAEPRIVYVTVTARTPRLASDVADAAIGALRHFDVEMRQTEAKDRRAFLSQRVADARSALDQAERAMATFLETNHFVEAPRLRYEQARLQRDIELKNQLFMTLSGQLETARIDEVNERPRITVIDAATAPTRAAPRMLPLFMLAGFVIGIVLGAIPQFTRSLALPDHSAIGTLAER